MSKHYDQELFKKNLRRIGMKRETEEYDPERYDAEGYDKRGFNRYGVHKNGTYYDENGLDAYGRTEIEYELHAKNIDLNDKTQGAEYDRELEVLEAADNQTDEVISEENPDLTDEEKQLWEDSEGYLQKTIS